MSDRTITHIRQHGPRHEHIERYVWVNDVGAGDASDKATMIDWMEKGGSVYVETGGDRVPVGVVRPHVGEPYLRSHADGKWTNDLLALPRF
ncbi:MAG: hypothetical protein QOJ72_3037 [Nocardioidaceae bacterium]|jgi:hypothetical protein|nr:hypothetical protein [Nocardioidaceae bacterium]